MALKKLNLTRGDSDNYTLTFLRPDGTPFNIKNWTVFFTLKKHWSLPDSQASLQKIVSTFSDTTSGTSGSANVPISPSDTENLDPGDYFFDFAVCTDQDDHFTILKGQFTLEFDVTHSGGTAGTQA